MSTARSERFAVGTVEGFADVRVQRPGLPYYLERLRNRSPYAFLKRTHGFWDRLVDLLEILPDYPWVRPRKGLRKVRSLDRILRRLPVRSVDPPWGEAQERVRNFELTEAMIEELESRSRFKNFWRGGFLQDLVRDIQSPCPEEGYIEAIAFSGFPGGAVRGRHDVRLLRHAWRAVWASDRIPHDALVWKDAVIGGGFPDLVRTLSEFSIVLIGPDHLGSFGERVGWSDTQHVDIHATAAIADRHEILDRCRRVLERARNRRADVVVVYQAGTLAVWLIRRLWPEFQDVFHLDVGIVLDAWYPDIVVRQRWFRDNREVVIRNLELGRLYGCERRL